MIGLDEVIEDKPALQALPLVVASEPPAPPVRQIRFFIPRIVDYLVVAAFIYFLF